MYHDGLDASHSRLTTSISALSNPAGLPSLAYVMWYVGDHAPSLTRGHMISKYKHVCPDGHTNTKEPSPLG